MDNSMNQDTQTQSSNAESMNLEQMFGQAEETLRNGLQTLTEWGDQARDIFQNRPGVVLASVSIAGFMTGLLLRQGGPLKNRAKGFTADPLIVFLTGTFAGFTLGPRILREVSMGLENQELGANVKTFERTGQV